MTICHLGSALRGPNWSALRGGGQGPIRARPSPAPDPDWTAQVAPRAGAIPPPGGEGVGSAKTRTVSFEGMGHLFPRMNSSVRRPMLSLALHLAAWPHEGRMMGRRPIRALVHHHHPPPPHHHCRRRRCARLPMDGGGGRLCAAITWAAAAAARRGARRGGGRAEAAIAVVTAAAAFLSCPPSWRRGGSLPVSSGRCASAVAGGDARGGHASGT
eukprot:scaffold3352_cov326-Prasinococcus_capsulatus_cf.AAC.3